MKLVLFFILSSALSLQAHAKITPVTISEISAFKADWCAQNQLLLQDIKTVCYGASDFNGETTRSIVIQRSDDTRELFIEADFSSVDMMSLSFEVIGPVATSKPREKFAPIYTGQVSVSVDFQGEVDSVSGTMRFAEEFLATRKN